MNSAESITLGLSLVAIAVSIWSVRVAKKAESRTAAYADAAFKIVRYRSNDAYMGVMLKNVGNSAAFNVKATLVNDINQQFYPFDHDDIMGESQVVEPGAEVWLATAGGEEWRSTMWGKGYNRLGVAWKTAADEVKTMQLNFPLVEYNEGPSFTGPSGV